MRLESSAGAKAIASVLVWFRTRPLWRNQRWREETHRWLPKSPIATLQRVQNAAACLVFGLGPRDHISAGLRQLHWLPCSWGPYTVQVASPGAYGAHQTAVSRRRSISGFIVNPLFQFAFSYNSSMCEALAESARVHFNVLYFTVPKAIGWNESLQFSWSRA